MKNVNEKRLFDAMSEISDAIKLLESAKTKLRVLDNSGIIRSSEVVSASLSIRYATEIFNELNSKADCI